MSERQRHPAVELDEVVHQRVRLGILAVLRATDAAEFGYLKEILELTDGNLHRHLDVLRNAGYTTATKSEPAAGATDRRTRTVIAITDAGRRAFDAELAQLDRLAELETDPRS